MPSHQWTKHELDAVLALICKGQPIAPPLTFNGSGASVLATGGCLYAAAPSPGNQRSTTMSSAIPSHLRTSTSGARPLRRGGPSGCDGSRKSSKPMPVLDLGGDEGVVDPFGEVARWDAAAARRYSGNANEGKEDKHYDSECDEEKELHSNQAALDFSSSSSRYPAHVHNFARALNAALRGERGGRKDKDIPVADVNQLLTTIIASHRGSLAFVLRQPSRTITSVQRQVWARAFGFDGSLKEWLGTDKEICSAANAAKGGQSEERKTLAADAVGQGRRGRRWVEMEKQYGRDWVVREKDREEQEHERRRLEAEIVELQRFEATTGGQLTTHDSLMSYMSTICPCPCPLALPSKPSGINKLSFALRPTRGLAIWWRRPQSKPFRVSPGAVLRDASVKPPVFDALAGSETSKVSSSCTCRSNASKTLRLSPPPCRCVNACWPADLRSRRPWPPATPRSVQDTVTGEASDRGVLRGGLRRAAARWQGRSVVKGRSTAYHAQISTCPLMLTPFRFLSCRG